MSRFVWILLFLALITGTISFGGFLTGATLVFFGRSLFFIIAVLFGISLVKELFYGNPPVPPTRPTPPTPPIPPMPR